MGIVQTAALLIEGRYFDKRRCFPQRDPFGMGRPRAARLKRGVAAGRSAQRGTSGAATGGGGRSAPDPYFVLTGNGASSLAAVGFVAPHRLNGVRLTRQGDVLETGPGALIAVFAGCGVVPAV